MPPDLRSSRYDNNLATCAPGRYNAAVVNQVGEKGECRRNCPTYESSSMR